MPRFLPFLVLRNTPVSRECLVGQDETQEFQPEALSASCIIRTHRALASQGAWQSEATDRGGRRQPVFAKTPGPGILSMGMGACASVVLSVSDWLVL